MARHVIKIKNLKSVVDHWTNEVTKLCGVPSENTKKGVKTIQWHSRYEAPVELGDEEEQPRDPPFLCYKPGVFESLDGPRWDRIKWFYFCDDHWGNTVRLFDEEHFREGRNASLYLERKNRISHLGTREDRVLIRTENIGKDVHPLKECMASIIGTSIWPSSGAPSDEMGRAPYCDAEKICEHYLDRRLAYFQNPVVS